MFHIIGYASTIVKRVSKSTFQAETYSLQAGVEEGDRLRAAVADLFGKLDPKKWEASSAATIKQIWFTDCENVVSACLRPTAAKLTDKRLSLEIAGLRQSLWRKPGQAAGEPHCEDERPQLATDLSVPVDSDGFSVNFPGDTHGDGISELLVREHPERLVLYPISVRRGEWSVGKRSTWELRVHEDAELSLEDASGRAAPELCVVEKSAVVVVRWNRRGR